MIFISYAWIEGKTDEKVLQLVAKLRERGFEAKCDVMFIGERTSIHFKQMMAENLQRAEKVVVVLSETYKKKADLFEGGVGVEYKYILEDIDINCGKYILVTFNSSINDKEIPDLLRGREIICLSQDFDKLFYRLENIPEYIFPEVNSTRKIVLSKTVLSKVDSNKLFFDRKENLPFIRNPFFSARKDIINSIHANFTALESRQIIQVLAGMGGVGKTQIAIEYAYSFLDNYQLIWWIKSDTKQGIVNSFLELGRNFKLSDVYLNLEEDDKIATIITKLNSAKNYLLIFDNANCYSEIEKYIPKSNIGSILITSRDNNWKMIGNAVNVDVFTPQEARDFLKKRTLNNNLLEADILSKRLGFLPLAMEQAAAYILNNEITFSDYITLFEKYTLKLFDLESSKPLNYAHTVTITSKLSVGKIDNQSAIQILKIISYLNADSVEISFFEYGKEYLPYPLSQNINNELLFREIIWELKRYSLIKEENSKISIHRLLQEVIREEESTPIYYKYAFNIIIYNMLMDKKGRFCLEENEIEKYGDYYLLSPHITTLRKYIKSSYKIGNESWYYALNLWYKYLFSCDSITGTIIITYINSFFEVVSSICFEIRDLDYFIDCFIWLVNENKYESYYINSNLGNYFLPLLNLLERFPDDLGCAFYIVLSIVGGRNGWKNRDKARDLKYLKRAKDIYSFYGRTEALDYISDYDRLIYSGYKWDKEFHDKLLR